MMVLLRVTGVSWGTALRGPAFIQLLWCGSQMGRVWLGDIGGHLGLVGFLLLGWIDMSNVESAVRWVFEAVGDGQCGVWVGVPGRGSVPFKWSRCGYV